MKKTAIICVLLCIFLLSSTVLAAGYKDVKSGSWYYQAVTTLSDQNIVTGYGNGTFLPDRNITRAEFVTMLAKASKEDLSSYGQSFTDVPTSHWAYSAVSWAAAKGITAGKSATEFAPSALITREEMVTMIYRFKKHQGTDLTKESTPYYSDFTSVSSYAQSPVKALYTFGGISGMGDNKFLPKSASTRAQSSQMLYNCMFLNERQRVPIFARNFLGWKYIKGGTTPESGFDAAGFVKYVYANFGVTLTGDETELRSQGTAVSKAGLNMGDILCFGGNVPHVGIYLGNNEFIHAVNSTYGVVVTSLAADYYSKNFVTGRRILP